MATSPDRSRSDVNLHKSLIVVSSLDGETPVSLWADPTTHALVSSGSGGGGGTQYTDGAAAIAHPIGTQPVFTSGAGFVTAVSSSNPLPVSGTFSAGTPSDTTATGSLTALNSTVVLTTNGVGTGIFEITGTWVGTITFEGSNNNFVTSQPISAVFLGGIQNQSALTTTNGYFSVITAGFAKVQARMSVYTSGTASVLANGSQADRIIVPIQGNPANNQTAASGDVANGVTDAGNPIKTGGKAYTGIPIPVADSQRVNDWHDELGRQVVSDKDPELGLTTGTTGLRDRIMAQRTTVLSDSMIDGIAGFWTQTPANGGAVALTSGEAQLSTSTAATGSMQMTSTTVVYFPGQVNWLNSAIRFNDTGIAGNVRRVGMFTVSGGVPQDGFYYELNGTTFNAVSAKAGVATAVASGSWTKFSTAPFTLDTNYHQLEIRYTSNSAWFYVDNVLRHNISGPSTPLTATLTFPIALQNINTTNATNVILAVRNIGNGRFGMPGGTVAETGLSAVETRAVGGGTPHASVDSGNPIKLGGYAKTTAPTAVSDGQRVNAWFTPTGQLNVALATAPTTPVTGTFFQATQPISAVSLPLPTGAALDATLTGGTQQTKLTDGTNIANVLKSDGTAAGQNSQLVGGTFLSSSFSTTTVQAVGTTDAGNYRWVSVQINAQGTTSTVAFQGSNDNVAWFSIVLESSTSTVNNGVVNATTTGVFHGPLPTRYFRLNVTGITALTTSGQIVFSTMPSVLHSYGVAANLTAGAAIVGKVGIDQTTIGTTNAVSVAQVGANTVLTGNGVTGTGSQRVTIASDNTAFAVNATLQTGANTIGAVNIAAAQTLATVTTVSAVTAITNALPAGTNLIGKVGIDQTTPGTTNAVTPVPAATGSLSVNRIAAAATTNATNIKASAGQIYGYDLSNQAAYDVFLKIYNKASAPTVGTDTPAFTIKVPANGGRNVEWSHGVPLGTGISYAITKLVADTDTTAVVASDLHGFILTK